MATKFFNKKEDDISTCFPFGWQPAKPEPGSLWATRQRMMTALIESNAEMERDKYNDRLWFSWNSRRERGEE